MHMKREDFDSDLTFSIGCLMERFRGCAEIVEAATDTGHEVPKQVSEMLLTTAEAIRLFAAQGDEVARHLADEMNALEGKAKGS